MRNVVDDSSCCHLFQEVVDVVGVETCEVEQVHFFYQDEVGKHARVVAQDGIHQLLHVLASLVQSVEFVFAEYESQTRLHVVFRAVVDVACIVEKFQGAVGLHGELLEFSAEVVDAEKVSGVESVAHTDFIIARNVLVGFANILLVGICFRDAACERKLVFWVVEQDGVRRVAVASCSSSLLEIGFDGVGQVVVDDESHVGLVDAHAECVGCHHHAAAVLGPVGLSKVALGSRESCMIVLSRDAVRLQQLRQLCGQSPTARIDDGTSLWHAFQDVNHLVRLVLRRANHIDEVLALETHGDGILLLEPQLVLNVIYHLWRGSGGECQDGHRVGDDVAQLRYLLIGRTEVIAPLRNAMGFIHTNHADVAHSFQFGAKQFASDSLRRNIKETVVAQYAVVEDAHHVVAHHARIDGFGFDATHTQLCHLVLHQRDERGNH